MSELHQYDAWWRALQLAAKQHVEKLMREGWSDEMTRTTWAADRFDRTRGWYRTEMWHRIDG